jgi:hypothetical protein
LRRTGASNLETVGKSGRYIAGRDDQEIRRQHP